METTPDRAQARKTYLGRKRRNRALASQAQESSSDSDASVFSEPETAEMENEPVEAKTPKKAGNKTPARKGPKNVDVELPVPSPAKRAGRDLEIEAPSSPKKVHENASSITSLKEVTLNVTGSPATSKKPASEAKKDEESPVTVKKSASVSNKEDESPVAAKKPAVKGRKKKANAGVAELSTKPVSVAKSVASEAPEVEKAETASIAVKKTRARRKAKSVIGDDDFDDAASVADSTISTFRIRRNETERIEYFKNQPECTSLEPHSVVCSKCGKSVNLGKRQTYAVRPWELHRARCDAVPGPEVPATPAPPVLEKPISAMSDMPPVTPISAAFKAPVPTPSSARRLTEDERKEFLQSDKQVKQLEESRVLCARCDQWIALSDSNPYITSNWTKHKLRCSDAMPSNRVAAAKRKLLLVNDNQVQKFTAHAVLCKNCAVTIELTGEGDYNLTAWEAHKIECLKSILFPSRVTLPRPLSASASTSSFTAAKDTPNAPDTPVSSGSLSQGVKRSREEDESPVVEGERPATRPRTADYMAPQTEPPNSLMGWFMLPFQNFVRGFKASLRDKP